MDHMDIDEIVAVADTPDRLSKPGTNGGNDFKTENQRSSLHCHGQKMFLDEGSRDQPMIIDSGSQGMSLCHSKCPSSPKNPRQPPTSASLSLTRSSSSRNANLFRKGATEKKASYLTHDSMHKHRESVRPSYTSKSSSSSQDDGILLTDWVHRPACGNASSNTVPGNNRSDFQKRSGLPNGASSSHELSNLVNASCNGIEETNNAGRGGLGNAFDEGAWHDGNNKKKPEFSPIHAAPPRVNKQKRLVRDGCISPNNIAKAKQLVGKDSNGSISVAHNDGSMAPIAHNNGSMESSAPPVAIEISELVAEDNDSTSIFDNLEVILLSSPTDAAISRSTSSNVNNMPQIIEVDESSPQLRRDIHDEDDRARQVEADELRARELQEQFYNELPVFGAEEIDEHIALQNQDGLDHGLSRGRQRALDARLLSNLHRQTHSRSSSNAPRRGSLARSSSVGRETRLRFPPDMDVDMRMHIPGALEEFSGMGTSAGILHGNRDFNESDYEMLLALDENNHGGASVHQINGLPQSTAQSDFDEACAICLDTPTTGDTIRHLPCLHKFHKDCIDPWLRRRTSCPVCKSSIT